MRCISSCVSAFRISGCAAGSLLTGELGIVRELDHADVLGVVGDARPVERRVDLDVVAQRMLDRLALEVLVGVAGIGDAVPDEPARRATSSCARASRRSRRCARGWAAARALQPPSWLRRPLRISSARVLRILFSGRRPASGSAMTATVAARHRGIMMVSFL